jgi:hypothetical protein
VLSTFFSETWAVLVAVVCSHLCSSQYVTRECAADGQHEGEYQSWPFNNFLQPPYNALGQSSDSIPLDKLQMCLFSRQVFPALSMFAASTKDRTHWSSVASTSQLNRGWAMMRVQTIQMLWTSVSPCRACSCWDCEIRRQNGGRAMLPGDRRHVASH